MLYNYRKFLLKGASAYINFFVFETEVLRYRYTTFAFLLTVGNGIRYAFAALTITVVQRLRNAPVTKRKKLLVSIYGPICAYIGYHPI
jgi:hypothetical protein